MLDRPEWRALVETELQEIPTPASMRCCLAALIARGSLPEPELLLQVIQAVDGQLERRSEEHAKVVRRRRRWLADVIEHPDADPLVEQNARASLSTDLVWEEMRRYRTELTVWREVTAGLA